MYKSNLAAVIIGITALSSAQALNITTNDPFPDKAIGGNTKIPDAPNEDGTVQWNSVATQSWDLESFDLNGTSLSFTGGFNFLTGKGSSTTSYPQGDIFVYLGGNPPDIQSDAWDYVIEFRRDSYGNIKDVDPTSGYSVAYRIVYSSSPSGTTALTQGSDAATPGLPWMLNGNSGSWLTGSYGNSGSESSFHNTIGGLDISSILDEGQDVYFHTTMKCGNDVLWGHVPSVPDGGTTLALLGLGMAALAGFGRRGRN